MKRVDEAVGNNKVIVRISPPSSILSACFEENADCTDKRSRSDSFSTLNTITNSINFGEVLDENPNLIPSINRDLEPVSCVVCAQVGCKEIHLKEPPNEHFLQGKEKITTFAFDGVFPSSLSASPPPPSEEKIIIQQQDQLEIYKYEIMKNVNKQ